MLAPSWDGGAADRTLGRWYYRVSGLFGDSKKKSVEHLQRALTYDAVSAASHCFGRNVPRDGRWDDIRRELEGVRAAPLETAWVPEVLEFQQKARKRLADRRRSR